MILEDKFTTNRTYQLLVHWVEDVHDYLNWASYKGKLAEVQIFQQPMFLVRTQLFCAIKVDSWKKKGGIASSMPGQNTRVRGA